jgi:hypothetical protein
LSMSGAIVLNASRQTAAARVPHASLAFAGLAPAADTAAIAGVAPVFLTSRRPRMHHS